MQRTAIKHFRLLQRGVNFDLRPISDGAFVIANKPSRIEKLGKMIAIIRTQGFITYAQASELQGLLNFAVGYFSGKSLKHLVSALCLWLATGHRQGSNS